MMKKLLSDFYNTTQRSYQPDTFQPYLSMILSIVTTTFLAYGIQIATHTLYAYANDPISFQNKILQKADCKIFKETSLNYLCKGVTNNQQTYKLGKFLSFEQDLQSMIK